MEHIIEIKNLYKSYQDIEAVKGISFCVKQGDFFAFLGENGAGKSTTINIIATLLKMTSGEVFIGGKQVNIKDDDIRKSLGVVFQSNMLDKHLTVRENIQNRGRLYHLSKEEVDMRLKELSSKIGLDDFLDRRYGQLSGGQKRRADIARALINRPKLLILDEPTTGLDPKTRQAVWQVIKKLNDEMGLTVFLTTHYMEEAAKADYVMIIDAGKIKVQGTPEQLRRQYSSDQLIMMPKNEERLIVGLKKMGYEFMRQKETVTVGISNSFKALRIVEALKAHIKEFEIIRGNMDDVFINVLSSSGQKGEVS